MVGAAENELLTRVGPGTPMGTLMRQYWVPACLSSELVADGDPMRLLLLGEKLVAFRDSSGRVGILDHRCPHRRTPLFFGRNEEDGLRCIYHGWKFDVAGHCLAMPNLPPEKDFHEKVRAKSYRAAERNGIVYAYMGERAEPPALPAIDALLCPTDRERAAPGQRVVTIRCSQRENNWLQSLEGDLDTSHFPFLHLGKVAAEDLDPANIHRIALVHRAPEFHVRDTGWGTMYAAYRPADPGSLYYRVAHFLFPFWTMFPDAGFDGNIVATAWVPMDDTHTMSFGIFSTDRPTPFRALKDGRPIPGITDDNLYYESMDYLPATSDWYGRWRFAKNRTNDYGIDRATQRTRSFTGIAGIPLQDMAVTEGMGEILDRTEEVLAPSDIMLVRTRRRLLDAAAAVAGGGVPPLVDDPDASRGVRSGCFVAPDTADWFEAYSDALRAALAKEPG